MIPSESLTGGFTDPVFQAQAVFRRILDAFSRPGSIVDIAEVVAPPAPLAPSAAAFLCILADEGTPVFLDSVLAGTGSGSVASWIRFHTGAPLVAKFDEAAFAVIGDPGAAPPLSAFSQGSAEYPDRSATVLLQVAGLSGGTPLRLEGPGIRGGREIAPHPLPDDFVAAMQGNRARYPRGVDVVLAAPRQLVALPRSVRIGAV